MTPHPTARATSDDTGEIAGSERATLSPLREMQLVEAARGGDRDALAALLDAYQRRLYAVCYRMFSDAEHAMDLTQESMVKIIEGLDGFDGRSKLSTWMIRVTMNCCLSELRRRRYRRHASLEAPVRRADGAESVSGRDLLESGELSAHGHVEQAEMRSVLVDGLGRLDPGMRALVVLRDLNELEYQQIADVLDLPLGTVKSRLFRARAALREAVEDILDEEHS